MTQVNRKSRFKAVDGILLVDKPAGDTSNQVLQRVRHGYLARKAGHTGTLDPFASGLLVCCFGHATKVSGLLLGADKTYRAGLRLGSATDSGDIDGSVVSEVPVPALDQIRIVEALSGLCGARHQVPPMYSALKVNGKRLYELARAGINVDREARPIVIHRLQLLSWSPNYLEFEVNCSKGTYVRTLGEEIATTLGTVGHLSMLRRTALGPFHVADAATPERLEQLSWPTQRLLGSDRALHDWPACVLTDEQRDHFQQGRRVAPSRVDGPCQPEAHLRVYDQAGTFLGTAVWLDEGRLQPKRLFVTADKG